MCLTLLAGLGIAPVAWATTETLTDTNSWTVPAGVTSVTVEMWGGGGGSGAKVYSGQAGRGGGGGGGGYTRQTLTVSPAASIAYSVGAVGLGGATNGVNGGRGGDTTFVGVTTAGGGWGGTNKTASGVAPAGGAGGTGGTANGGAGEVGAITQANGAGGGAGGWTGSAGQNGGAGGGVTAGTGGIGGGTAPSKGGNGGSTTVNGTPGSPGGSPGGGASGGSAASSPTQSGTNGASGLIILTYTAASSTPILDTATKSAITTTTATLGATVVTNSGNTIDDYGIVYSQTTLNNDPTVGGGSDIKVQKGTSVANGTTFTTNIVGLTPGTQYSFKGYAHTASGYGYSTVSSFFTLANEPTVQASSAGVTSTQRGAFAITWTRGNGANCIVLVRAGSAVDSAPVDGTTYTASVVFGSGTQIGSSNYVAYIGTGNSVTLSNMAIGTTYYVAVYEVNGAGGSENYLTATPATNSAAGTGNIYYSTGSGTPTTAANWTNSLGFSPANFNGGDTFVILSGQTITAADSWTNNNGTTLIIDSGATLDMFSASRKLLINGNFVNNGTLINSFDGTAPIVNFINAFSAGATTNFTSALTVGSNYNVSVVAIGGGGGGASAGNPSNSIPVTGGGGGGGASAYSTNLVLQAGNAYQVTVGANGARASAGNGFGGSGSAGGASSFGGGFLTSIVANGGGAGLASTFDGTNVIQGANGAGGAAGTTGNAGNYAGGSAASGGGGGAAGDTSTGGNASGGTGGTGGSGSIASGGAGGSATANTAGGAGGAPGGGGSGANWTTGANKAGGTSGVGWVSVQFNSVDTSVSTANYIYRSKASGNWDDNNTWQVDKGSGFVDASSGETPNSGHSSVLVRSGHTVTVAASAVTVNLTVTNGGSLTVSGGGMTVNRVTGQTTANNLTVYGTLNLAMDNALLLGNNTTNLIAAGAVLNQTTATAVSFGTSVQLVINGSYLQNVTGSGIIPVAIWGAASTCTINSTFAGNIDASSNDIQLNYGQSFANFIWNAQGGTTNVVYRMAKSSITNWNVSTLTISNTAGTPARLELTGTPALSTSVTNLTVTGGNFRAGGGGSALTVKGPLAISAGSFDTGGTIAALDNVSITGAAQVTGSARFSFAKAGAQAWTVTATNALTGPSWVVDSGTALSLGSASKCVVSDLTVNGSLTVTGSSTLLVNGSFIPTTNNAGSITVGTGSGLGGNGGIGASVTLSAGAFATNTIGFDTNGLVNSTLSFTNALALNGNIIQVSTGTNVLAVGDYLLITNTIGGISGSFSSSPVISGAGLAGGTAGTVVTTANTVVLHVVAASTNPPVITSTVLNGSSLIISGTNSSGSAGGTYYVRATNDLTIPFASWPRISTNIYGTGGAFSVTNAVNPSVPQNFYRIEQ